MASLLLTSCIRVYEPEILSADEKKYVISWEEGVESAQPLFPRGHSDDGAEVRDRRTGERLVRYAGDDVRVRAVGERLVISVGAEEDVREYVVDASGR